MQDIISIAERSVPLNEIWHIISFLIQNRYILIVIYIGVLWSIVIWIKYTKKVMRKVEYITNKNMDHIRYTVSSMLYNNKNNIHDFKNTIPLLLYYKTESLEHSIPYRSHIDKIISESDYIYSLVGNNESRDYSELKSNAWVLERLFQTKKRLYTLYNILTLSIGTLFLWK
mgnify:FL=1